MSLGHSGVGEGRGGRGEGERRAPEGVVAVHLIVMLWDAFL